MRTLSTIPTRQAPPAAPMTPRSVRRRSPGPGCRNLGGPLGAFARPGGMRTDRRTRPPRRTTARWVQDGSEPIKPPAPALSPLSTDLLITTRVREFAAAEAQERRDRQIAAVARLLRRAAGSQGALEGSRYEDGER